MSYGRRRSKGILTVQREGCLWRDDQQYLQYGAVFAQCGSVTPTEIMMSGAFLWPGPQPGSRWAEFSLAELEKGRGCLGRPVEI